jgi:hypothetical protein
MAAESFLLRDGGGEGDESAGNDDESLEEADEGNEEEDGEEDDEEEEDWEEKPFVSVERAGVKEGGMVTAWVVDWSDICLSSCASIWLLVCSLR